MPAMTLKLSNSRGATMKRMLIHIEESQYETLRRLAYERNGNMSEIIREALNQYFGGDKMVEVNGNIVDFDAAVNLMDDDIREELHQELAPCTNQEFIDEYIKRHREKFGEEFTAS